MLFKTNKILTILLLLILFVGCTSNQNKYARKDYTQGELDDYLSDNYTQGELDDDFLTDNYYPVFPIGIMLHTIIHKSTHQFTNKKKHECGD